MTAVDFTVKKRIQLTLKLLLFSSLLFLEKQYR